MMRFGAMAVSGVLGVVLLKVLAALLMPLLGAVAGMMMVGMKVLFWGAIAYVVYRIFFRRREKTAEV